MTEPCMTEPRMTEPRMTQAIATLINARWIVPVEPEGQVLEHHALAIDGGRILAILPQAEAAAR